MTLMGLANHADMDGSACYPSLDTLARYTGKTTRQVRRDLRLLEVAGAIRLGDQSRARHLRGDRRPTVYDLAMPREDAHVRP